ncbi:hypothetical protein IJT93_05260 [bacterium]|nr:hypothetical protein [bacterium]
MESLFVNTTEYKLIKLLGHGKGGYSYLAQKTDSEDLLVLKQIHHEPCSYYSFGNKIEAEERDYYRLKQSGIRIPLMLDIDRNNERIVKEYIEGDTIFEIIKNGQSADPYLDQVLEMSARARSAGINIDYFPTNFVVSGGLLYYIDYECNGYMEEWSFERWGKKYWSNTEEFRECLKSAGS